MNSLGMIASQEGREKHLNFKEKAEELSVMGIKVKT